MADAASITVELQDKITGPAKKMAASLKNLNAQMAKFNKSQKRGAKASAAGAKAAKASGKASTQASAAAAKWSANAARAGKQTLRNAQVAALNRKAMAKLKTATSKAGGAASKAAGGWADLRESLFGQMTAANLAASAIQMLGQAAIRAAKWVVGAIAKGVKFAESLQFALTSFLGGSEQAGQAITKLMKTANNLGLSFEEAGSNFKEFVSAGASEMEAMDLVRFRADMEALAVGVTAPEQISEAFKQLSKAMAIGKFEMEGFESVLRGLPVELPAIMEKLAPKIGKETGDLVDKFGKLKISMSELPVKETIEAMKEALLEAGNASSLGEIAIRKQTSTVSGMIDFMRKRLGNVFTELGVKLGPGLQKSLLPVLKRVITLLKSDAFSNFITMVADKMVAGIDSAVTSITEFIAMFEEGDPSLVKDLVVTFMEVSAALNMVTGLFGAFRSALTSTGPETSTIINLLRLLATVWLAVAKVILTVVGGIASVIGVVFDFVIGKIFGLVKAITGIDLSGSAASIGAGIIDGIIAGINAGVAWLIATLDGVVAAVIKFVKNKLGMSSPSKVFADIGGFSMEGFSEGVEDQGPAVASSTAGVLDPGALMGMGGGTTNNMQASSSATINVSGAADPEATAAAVRSVIVGELAGAFEQLNIEVSGG